MSKSTTGFFLVRTILIVLIDSKGQRETLADSESGEPQLDPMPPTSEATLPLDLAENSSVPKRCRLFEFALIVHETSIS